jgi:hypothetical protein
MRVLPLKSGSHSFGGGLSPCHTSPLRPEPALPVAPSAVDFRGGWPARRQPTFHQLLAHCAAVPELHSPSPGGACEAASRRSRNRTDRVVAVVARQKPRACPWSSDRWPRTRGSADLGPMNRPGCQRDLVTAAGTLPPPLIHQVVRSPISAARTDEALGPAAGREVLFAGFLGGEVSLKLP